MKTSRFLFRSERGSLLIVAMIFAAIIGVSLASYLQLGRSSLTISNRALYNQAAMNVAENGLEEAMYSINRRIADPSYNWAGWTTGSGNAWRQFPATGSYSFDQGATGVVRVHVSNYLGNTPDVVARSTITLGDDPNRSIEKWVRIQLKKTSKFANGLVARQTIRFSGTNASVDSWNSDPDNNPVTAAIPYSSGVKRAQGTVAGNTIAVDAVLLHNVSIWGYATTGGTIPSVGSSGAIGPFGTPAGTIIPGHVATDFTAHFDPVAAPATSGYMLGSITGAQSLPRVGDAAAADGRYYYTLPSITLNNAILQVLGTANRVVLRLTDPLTSIDVTGSSGEIRVDPGCTLEIYAPGDITIAGRGLLNGGTTAATANPPGAVQIWGTKASGVQTLALVGNGTLSAVVYAPQGSLRLNGTGDICGSFVANDIVVADSAAVHYDESLSSTGGNNPFRVTVWQELASATSRTPFSAALSF